MLIDNQATRIKLFDFKSAPMRAFHMSWLSFHLCFFGWFGIAPLMAVVREDLGLTQVQVGNTMIASVAITVLMRFLIGPLCDRFGPRRSYSMLLILGSLPVMSIALADSYESFLLARLVIGVIGASFVITQYHTSLMFAPNVVGTANATSAGWGNLGGGTTQILMPLIFMAMLTLGISEAAGWRLAMLVPGVMMMFAGVAYYLFTCDLPGGDYRDLRPRDPSGKGEGFVGMMQSFLVAARDVRVWSLFVVYAACFGIELTITNIAALYFFDNFSLSLRNAGLIAGLFGLMNIFARTTGGVGSDYFARRYGLNGRVNFLFFMLVAEGLALLLFSQMTVLTFAVLSMLLFSLFVQMAEGATFGIVPFVNRRAMGSVAGIVGAGGNMGAVAAAFLFRSEELAYADSLYFLGCAVLLCSVFALAVRFPQQVHEKENRAMRDALSRRDSGKNAMPAANLQSS